jgi:sugar phosphate isomerase/epimerase
MPDFAANSATLDGTASSATTNGVAAFDDLARLCIHTITTKPWSLDEAADAYAEAGVPGITVWREAINGSSPQQAGERLRASGLDVVSYVRGGFFAATTALDRQAAVDENRRIIDEAAALGAPLIVLVVGADPQQSLGASRAQIEAGLEAVLPHAESCGVKLGIEPLHPAYADSRSAVNTLAQANDMAESFASDHLGVVVDVYHLWWDPALEREIARCGRAGNLFAYHVCDWKTPTEHPLLDRGLMGEGCIPLRQIRGWVEEAGFDGFVEVEVFSKRYWSQDQHEYLDKICAAHRAFS